MGRKQRMLDEVAQKFGGRQLACVEVSPLCEQAPGLDFVVSLERVSDVGEVVRELAEPEREIEHRHVEGQAEQAVHMDQRRVNAPARQRRHQYGDAPHHPCMSIAASIEVAGCRADPAGERVVDRIAARQRLDLLE